MKYFLFAILVSLTTLSGLSQKITRDAEFPGGITEWKKFIDSNLDRSLADTFSHWGNLDFSVTVRFIVAKDGSVTDVHVRDAKKKPAIIVAEAIRLVSSSPKWLPALRNGKPVRDYKQQAITWVISDE